MIDHLVYATHQPDRAAALIERELGVTFSPGGRHPERGTVNRLLRLGDRTYLELLAPDATNPHVSPPRWMGVDHVDAATTGRLTRWAWAVTKGAAPTPPGAPGDQSFGPLEAGSRALADGTTLRWSLTDPGASPLIKAHPFLIDWLGQPTPATRLADGGCRLESLTVYAPEPALLSWLNAPGLPLRYAYYPKVRLEAIITNDRGRKVILV